MIAGNFIQNHALSHVVEQLLLQHAGFLKNPVRQAVKAQNLGVHYAVVRMQIQQRPLRAERHLFRHQIQNPLLRLPAAELGDFPLNRCRFSGSGRT